MHGFGVLGATLTCKCNSKVQMYVDLECLNPTETASGAQQHPPTHTNVLPFHTFNLTALKESNTFSQPDSMWETSYCVLMKQNQSHGQVY